jgi:hypothetical protein
MMNKLFQHLRSKYANLLNNLRNKRYNSPLSLLLYCANHQYPPCSFPSNADDVLIRSTKCINRNPKIKNINRIKLEKTTYVTCGTMPNCSRFAAFVAFNQIDFLEFSNRIMQFIANTHCTVLCTS